jgi:hypothetical protein
MGNHEETVQDTKGQCGHGKEVHLSDHFTVVVQESRPALCRHRTPRDLPHPAQDRSLRDVEAEDLQLAMNARSAPGWVFSHHAEDEFAQFPAHASPAYTSAMPREPLPVQLESGPMPTDNRLRPHEKQRTLPSIPEPPQHHPEQFVRDSKPRRCGCLRLKTVSCCRRARFSRSNSRRERRSRIARTGRSLSRQSMSQSRMETGNAKHVIHLIDLTADHYFGERQAPKRLR